MSTLTQYASRDARQAQRGAATILIVMVLFFVMALAAVSASRSQLLDVRMASNLVRADAAVSIADAGGEWALSLLNGVKLDDACRPANGGTSLLNRAFAFSGDRTIAPISGKPTEIARCAWAANGTWSCQCNPATFTAPVGAAVTDTDPFFQVFATVTEQPGSIQLAIQSCTLALLRTDCVPAGLGNNTAIPLGASNYQLFMDAALIGALRVQPGSPLIAQGSIDLGTSAEIENTDPTSHGLIAQAGASITGAQTALRSLPGTPASDALLTDSQLLAANISTAEFFRRYFGMFPTTYRDQPAVRRLVCPNGGAGDCGPNIASLYASGARMIWIDGGATISSNLALGTLADPVLLIVSGGDLNISAGFLAAGLVSVEGNITWTGSGVASSLLSGGMMATGDIRFVGTSAVAYSPAVFRTLKHRVGSFVRVAGSHGDKNDGYN